MVGSVESLKPFGGGPTVAETEGHGCGDAHGVEVLNAFPEGRRVARL